MDIGRKQVLARVFIGLVFAALYLLSTPIPYQNRTFVFRCPHPLRRAGFPPVAKGSPDWAGNAGTGLFGGMRACSETSSRPDKGGKCDG